MLIAVLTVGTQEARSLTVTEAAHSATAGVGEITVTGSLSFADNATGMTIVYTLPDGWNYVPESGAASTGSPAFAFSDSRNELAVFFMGDPESPLAFEFRVTWPGGDATAHGEVQYTDLTGNLQPPVAFQPDPLELPPVQAGFETATSAVDEDAGEINVDVVLSKASLHTVTVTYAFDGGTAEMPTDYTASVEPVAFTPGITRRTIGLSIVDDDQAEQDETVVITLDSAGPAALATTVHTVTIHDNDAEPEELHVTAEPSSLLVNVGDAAAFSVAAAGGTPPYTYRWQKDGAEIPGAPGSANPFTIDAARTIDQGAYRCEIQDAADAIVLSEAAQLTVNSYPTAIDDEATTMQGTPVDVPVTDNDFDLDGSLNLASVTVTTPPDEGTAIPNDDGTITYTPADDAAATVVTFAYTVSDNHGSASNEATVTISVYSGWVLPVETIGLQVSPLTLGMVSEATDGFDPDPDEHLDVLAPPAGQDTGYGAFQIEGGWNLMRDVHAIADNGVWLLRITAPVGTPARIAWQAEDVPVQGLYIRRTDTAGEPLPGEICRNMLESTSVDVPAGATWYFEITYGALVLQIRLQSGWNLIALPFVPLDTLPDAVLRVDGAPVYLGPAWTWNGILYERLTAVLPGVAFWAYRLGDPVDVVLYGRSLADPVHHLGAGWRMCGAISSPPFNPVPLPLASTPDGALSVAMYIWDAVAGGYAPISQQVPCGAGFWLYLNSEADVTLGPPAR
jgi:hypothetical protein